MYCLEGSIAVTGSAVQWLRDQFGIISGASQSEALARQVEDNGGMYFVPAFSGLFAPYWRADARGAIVGLSRFNTNAQPSAYDAADLALRSDARSALPAHALGGRLVRSAVDP